MAGAIPSEWSARRVGPATPLWRRIQFALEQEIVTGALGPGDRLPTETELSARFDVNRHTVRRAMGRLRERHLIRVEQGRGSFVQERSIAHEIGPNSKLSATACAFGRETQRQTLGHETVKADKAVAAALGVRHGAPIRKVDTLRVLDGRPIGTASHFFTLPRFEGVERELAAHGSITRTLEHFGIAPYRRGRVRISARACSHPDARRLGIVRGSPVLATFNVNLDAAGRPVMASVSRFAASWIEFVVEPSDL